MLLFKICQIGLPHDKSSFLILLYIFILIRCKCKLSCLRSRRGYVSLLWPSHERRFGHQNVSGFCTKRQGNFHYGRQLHRCEGINQFHEFWNIKNDTNTVILHLCILKNLLYVFIMYINRKFLQTEPTYSKLSFRSPLSILHQGQQGQDSTCSVVDPDEGLIKGSESSA